MFESTAKSADLVVERIVRALKKLATNDCKPSKLIKRAPVFHKNSPWCLLMGLAKKDLVAVELLQIFLISTLFNFSLEQVHEQIQEQS